MALRLMRNHFILQPCSRHHMKISKKLILAGVLTTIMIGAGSNQIFLKLSLAAVQQHEFANSTSNTTINIRPNIQTDFNPNVTSPKISKTAFVDPFAVVIGDCEIGKLVLVAPFAVCRGDEGTPIYIGDYSNLQDGVILHALETTTHGKNIDDRRYSTQGLLLKANDTTFKNGFAIYVGNRVSLAHDVQVHGPAYIGNDTFVGMKSLVFSAKLGKRDAIGVSSTITNGVTIPDYKFVPLGSIIATQVQADKLPARVGSPYEKLNDFVLHVNQELAKGYNAQTIHRLAAEIEDEIEQQEMLQTESPTGNPNATANSNITQMGAK